MSTAKVDVGRRDVIQALVIALMIVMIYEGFDLVFQITWQEVFFQQNAVLLGLMPPLDLPLGLRVIWCTANVIHAFVVKPLGQLTRDIAGAIIAE